MTTNNTAADTVASYVERMTTGDLARHAGAPTGEHETRGYRGDNIAPTESAAAYGRRTAIVDDGGPAGPPEPRRFGFKGVALHPFAPSVSPVLIGRCRHCWGVRGQH